MQSRYCEQGNTDEYGLIRTDTDMALGRVRAMRSGIFKVHGSHASCANRPTCPTSPTCPTFFAPTLCIAQCALPANSPRSYVLLNFRSAQPPHSPVPIVRTSPYKSVQVRIPLPAVSALRKVPCQPASPPCASRKVPFQPHVQLTDAQLLKKSFFRFKSGLTLKKTVLYCFLESWGHCACTACLCS